jgi:hypothetical protein
VTRALSVAEIRAERMARLAAALTAAPPDGITDMELFEEAGGSLSRLFDDLGSLARAGLVTCPASRRYAPVPGADIAGHLGQVAS